MIVKNLTILVCCFALTATAQNTATLTTSGNKILDRCGEPFIIRGVNYSLADDWNFPYNLSTGKELSSQIAQSRANTVRIQWYAQYHNTDRPTLTIASLDSVITRFKQQNIVSIVELHDVTGPYLDTNAVNNTLMSFWLNEDVLNLINKHKSHLILNIANEYGPVLYPEPTYTLNPNYNDQIVVWIQHNKSMIRRLRNAGIVVPIMIDAPNFGMDMEVLLNNATTFRSEDPLQRIILSIHAYWPDETASQFEARVDQLAASNVPFIFGELANLGWTCETSVLPLPQLLARAHQREMGWLAWTWHRDICTDRNLTLNDDESPSDGLFSTLTAYGQTIVNTPIYGIMESSIKATANCPLSIESKENYFKIYPNPAITEITLQLNNISENIRINIIDINGKLVLEENSNLKEFKIDISSLLPGTYIVSITTDHQQYYHKLLK